MKKFCNCGSVLDAYTIASSLVRTYKCPVFLFQIAIALEALSAGELGEEEPKITHDQLILLKREIQKAMAEALGDTVREVRH